eukprot:497504-Rhodomonas_salina.2
MSATRTTTRWTTTTRAGQQELRSHHRRVKVRAFSKKLQPTGKAYTISVPFPKDWSQNKQEGRSPRDRRRGHGCGAAPVFWESGCFAGPLSRARPPDLEQRREISQIRTPISRPTEIVLLRPPIWGQVRPEFARKAQSSAPPPNFAQSYHFGGTRVPMPWDVW